MTTIDVPDWVDGTTPYRNATNLNKYTTVARAQNTRLDGLGISVKDPTYGAAGDGVTNDATAIQAAINAASAAGGGRVYLPAGTYLVGSSLVMATGVYLVGDGIAATKLKKSGDFILLKFWGSASGDSNHLYWAGACGMTLDGNGHTGTCLDIVYCTALLFRDIHCAGNDDLTIDIAESWDSRFYNVSTDDCGSLTLPALRISAGRAASGFGSTSDSSNQLMFFGLRIETWKNGAILIDPGASGLGVYQLYFYGLKIESFTVAGPAIQTSGNTFDVHFDDVWIFSGDFAGGVSTAQDAFILYGDHNVTARNVHIANGSVATIGRGLDVWNDSANVDSIHGTYTTPPTDSHVVASGGTNLSIGQISCTAGNLFGGSVMTTIPYAATITPDAAQGPVFSVTATNGLTLNPPDNPRDRRTITVEVLASGAGRTVTVGAGIQRATGVSTSLAITSGKIGIFVLVYSSFAGAWIMTSATQTQ